MLRRLASVGAATAIIAGVACAQGDLVRPGEGTYYLGGGARWTSISGSNNFAVSATGGYLFTKNIAGELSWGYTDTFGEWQSTIGLKAKYLFGDNAEFVPYLDAGAVYSAISGTNDTEYEVGAGFDYFIKPHQSIYVDVQAYKLGFDFDWTWDTSIGFRVWFK